MKDIIIGLSLLWLIPWSISATIEIFNIYKELSYIKNRIKEEE